MEAARREVNAQEMAEIPRARLEPLDIDLGEISDNTEHDMILANTGQVGLASFPQCPLRFSCRGLFTYSGAQFLLKKALFRKDANVRRNNNLFCSPF